MMMANRRLWHECVGVQGHEYSYYPNAPTAGVPDKMTEWSDLRVAASNLKDWTSGVNPGFGFVLNATIFGLSILALASNQIFIMGLGAVFGLASGYDLAKWLWGAAR